MSALEANPFFVLELPVTAGPREVEREAARLLGMLELGLAAAATYATPLGPRTRRAEDVRAAAATLRDPRKRLVAELWATAQGAEVEATEKAKGKAEEKAGPGAEAGEDASGLSGTGTGTGTGWEGAMEATGWGRR